MRHDEKGKDSKKNASLIYKHQDLKRKNLNFEMNFMHSTSSNSAKRKGKKKELIIFVFK